MKTKHALFLSAWVAIGTAAACGGDDPSGNEPEPDGGATDGDAPSTGGSATDGGAGGESGSGGGTPDSGAGGSAPDATPDAALDASDGSAPEPGDAGPDAVGSDSGGEDAGPTIAMTLTITPGAEQHAISPYVYGLQVGSVTTGATATRLGGASLSAYNWEINATNVRQGAAHPNQALGTGGEPGAAVSVALNEASTNGGLALLTVPIGAYVAADATGDDVLQTANHLTTRFKQNVAAKGTTFSSPPDTTDDFVYQDEFVDWVKTQAGATPVVFNLDNEPSLWQLDHVAFHPTLPTYDEVVSRSIEFATAVKGAWPEAGVSGPVSYGWLGMRTLQDAGLAGGPDVGKGDFLEYYLDRLAAAESTGGTRLLDYLDFHWWPEVYVSGVRIIDDDASPEVVEARVQAPRSLWDSGYVESSWITGAIGGAINLIPRMKATIAAHYPGTKLSLSAWDYGGGGDISGALAAADVLGILGREGVDLATASPIGQTTFTKAAFKAFLDYDGSGARFGDTSVAAATSDRLGSSVYASIDSGTPTSVTVIAINKRDFARDATIAISSSTQYTSVDVWELTATGATFVADAALPATGSNTFAYQMPAMSVAVLVPRP